MKIREKELQKGFELLLAHRLLFAYWNNEQCIAWSIRMMQQDYTSDYLNIIAGLDKDDSYSVSYYLPHLFDELGLNTDIDQEDLFHCYVCDIAQRVVDGVLDPFVGLFMLVDLHTKSYDYPFSAVIFGQLSELDEAISMIGEYSIYYNDLTNENEEEAIVNEMKLLLYKVDCDHILSNRMIYCESCKLLVYRVFDYGAYFAKSNQCKCERYSSKTVLVWDSISDQKQILAILEKEKRQTCQ